MFEKPDSPDAFCLGSLAALTLLNSCEVWIPVGLSRRNLVGYPGGGGRPPRNDPVLMLAHAQELELPSSYPFFNYTI